MNQPRFNKPYFRFLSVLWILVVLTGYTPVWAQGTAMLKVTINDADTGTRTPVRVALTDDRGHHTLVPEGAIKIMYGQSDRGEGYDFLPDSAFYADGRFEVNLNQGRYELAITKGNEYLEQTHSLNLTGDLDTTFVLERWINMPEKGWYSADDHIHMRRSPRENPLLLRWIAAEDIHVGHLLQMGDYHTMYYAQYAFGEEGRYHEHEDGKGHYHILSPGQEDPRTHEIGHTISLAADSLVRSGSQYYYYDRLADKIHELDGFFGYAHQGVTFHGYRGMTLDVFDDKVDFLEILQTCVEGGPLETTHYYHFLNLGFQITATAGSDFPWCGISRYLDESERKWDSRIGNVRFYTWAGKDYSFENWKKGMEAGHTFVSNGPAIELTVNGQLPGSVIDVKKGEDIRISATAYGHEGQVPLESLELIGHGSALDRVSAGQNPESKAQLTLQRTMRADKGIWIAAKVKAGPLQYAHTTPVYIRVNGEGFHYPEELHTNLDKAESYLDELASVLDNQDKTVARNEAWRYKEGLMERIKATRKKIEELRSLAE